jgi:hypothetical protein
MQIVPRAQSLQESPAFARVLRQAQQVQFEDWPEFIDPATPGMPDTPPWAGSLVLGVAAPPGHVGHFHRRLAAALAMLSQSLHQDTLRCVPLARGASWYGSSDAPAHAPLQRARRRAVSWQLPDGFDGALVLSPLEVPAVMPLWFWSERCGGVQGGIAFTWGHAPVFGQLCAHGNLHLDVYDTTLLQGLTTAAPACGWVVVHGACVEPYGRGGRITGRRLQV